MLASNTDQMLFGSENAIINAQGEVHQICIRANPPASAQKSKKTHKKKAKKDITVGLEPPNLWLATQRPTNYTTHAPSSL